jgi:hypothetical protein
VSHGVRILMEAAEANQVQERTDDYPPMRSTRNLETERRFIMENTNIKALSHPYA